MTAGDKGCYQLLIRLDKTRRIRIGKLGLFSFPRGWYVYTGSAMNGLSARISRHLRKRKKRHWHIDYFLDYARVVGIKTYPGDAPRECEINAHTFQRPDAEIIVKKFGSSDCRCRTHLAYFPSKPNLPFEVK